MNDMVARVEARIEGVVKRAGDRVAATMSNVERPIGSEKVSERDELEEYMLTIAMAPDPKAAYRRRIEERVKEGFSTEQALTWAVDWAERNEKRIAEMQNENST